MVEEDVAVGSATCVKFTFSRVLLMKPCVSSTLRTASTQGSHLRKWCLARVVFICQEKERYVGDGDLRLHNGIRLHTSAKSSSAWCGCNSSISTFLSGMSVVRKSCAILSVAGTLTSCVLRGKGCTRGQTATPALQANRLTKPPP